MTSQQGYSWQYSSVNNLLSKNENNLNSLNANASSIHSQNNSNVLDYSLPKQQQLLGQTAEEAAVLASGYEGKRLFAEKQLVSLMSKESEGSRLATTTSMNAATNNPAGQLLIRPSGGSFSYSGQQQQQQSLLAAQPVLLKQQFSLQQQPSSSSSSSYSLQSPQLSSSPIAFNLSPERLSSYSQQHPQQQQQQQIALPLASITVAQQLSQLQQNLDKQPPSNNKGYDFHAENTFSSPASSIELNSFPRTPSKTLVCTSLTPAANPTYKTILNTTTHNNNTNNNTLLSSSSSSSVSRPAEINSSYSRMYLSVPKAELNLKANNNNDDSFTSSPTTTLSNSGVFRRANPMRGSSSCKPLAAQQLQQYQISPKTASAATTTTTTSTTASAVTLKNNKENFNNSLTKIFFNSPRLKQDIQDVTNSNDRQSSQQLQLQQQQQQDQVSSASYQSLNSPPSDSLLSRGNAQMEETTKRQRPPTLNETEMKSPAGATTVPSSDQSHLESSSFSRHSPQPRLLFASTNNQQSINATKEIMISSNTSAAIALQQQQQQYAVTTTTTKNINLDGRSGNIASAQLLQQQPVGGQSQQLQGGAGHRENSKLSQQQQQNSEQNISGKASRSGSCSQKQSSSSSSSEQLRMSKQQSSSTGNATRQTNTQRFQDNSSSAALLYNHTNNRLNRDSSSSSSSAKHSQTNIKSTPAAQPVLLDSVSNVGFSSLSSSSQSHTPQMLGSKGKLKLASFKNAVAGSSSQPSTNVYAVKVNTFMKNFANANNNTNTTTANNNSINGQQQYYPSSSLSSTAVAGSPNSSKLMTSTKLLFERKTTSQLNENSNNNDTSRVAERISQLENANKLQQPNTNNTIADKSYADCDGTNNNNGQQLPSSSIVCLKEESTNDSKNKSQDNNKFNVPDSQVNPSYQQQQQQLQSPQEQSQYIISQSSQEQPAATTTTTVRSGALLQLSIASVTNFPQAVSPNTTGTYDSSSIMPRTTSNAQSDQQQQQLLKALPTATATSLLSPSQANPLNLQQQPAYESPKIPLSQLTPETTNTINNNNNNPSASKTSGLNSFITQVSQNVPLISLAANSKTQQVRSIVPSAAAATKVSSPKSSSNTPSNRQLSSKLPNQQYGSTTPLSSPSGIASSHKFKSFRHQNSNGTSSFAANKSAQQQGNNTNNLTAAGNIPQSLPESQSTSESNDQSQQHPSGTLAQQAKENNYKSNSSNSNSASKTLKKSTNSLKKQDSIKATVSPQIIEHLYYASSLAHAFENPSDLAVVPSLARDHLVQTMQSINFSRMITPPTMEQIKLKRVPLPPIKEKLTKTLIFDLDETLIHCNENADVPSDVTIDITFPTGEQVQAGINIRPYAVECLKELSELYEIIVFTASHSCYANVVLDYLDPQKKYISYRLFREQCVLTEEGVYVKDLRVIGNRSLENMLLVDNAAYSFGFQLDNGIPILPFYDHENDVELKHLITYLKNLYLVEDARAHNKKTLKISQFSQYQDPSLLLKALYPELLRNNLAGNNNNSNGVGIIA